MRPEGSRMRSEPLQTRLSQAGGGQRGYVKSIERGKVGLEAASLIDVAARWGLSGHTIHKAHLAYLHGLATAAVADGVVTDTEYRDLRQVAGLLGVEPNRFEELLADASRKGPGNLAVGRSEGEPLRRECLAGKRVCFTGESQCRVSGEAITRERAKELAAREGMVVVDSVTKTVDILVAADPLTQSGKASKARKYGIRIVGERAFWQALAVEVQ
jgi:DNA polymerase-3 subunit epsilon